MILSLTRYHLSSDEGWEGRVSSCSILPGCWSGDEGRRRARRGRGVCDLPEMENWSLAYWVWVPSVTRVAVVIVRFRMEVRVRDMG